MWATYFGSRPTHLLDGCPEQDRCKLTYDRSLIKNASAVVFHLRDVSVAQLPKAPSFDGQKFVAFTQESPPNSIGDVRGLPKSYFHWSMTYLNVSDVPYRYGGPWISRETAQKRGLPPLNLTYSKEEIIQQKKVRGAVWFVSNCNTASGRERALSALSRHGLESFESTSLANVLAKSTLNFMPRGSICDGVFGQYYFYVAAENSICQDYITEKYWGRVRYPSVPIVMRRYIYVRHLPPNSFIAMDDFESPSAMAARLTYLMDNPDEYMMYFAWRKQGLTLPKAIHGWTGMCNLCMRLVRGDYSRKDDRIPDFGRWYSDQSRCEDNSFATTWSKDKT
ncbi:alpha1,3-fucosyltransferase [Aphelenchoides avenae]|nr:alpha1,3-fucosyltransferase [Aphelenchus avenae]